jgi:DNA-binding LacI/PurR family transcriptional regulator
VARIQDVALHAGVSISTVSNVLNGRVDRMRDETRVRVENAIATLGFSPNRAARLLKTGHTPMLGLLVPSIANPMYGHIAREIEHVALERYRHRLLFGNTYRDPEKESSFLQDLLLHGVRTAIVISSLEDESHFEPVIRRGMTVVSYDRRATAHTKSDIDHVTVDNFKAGQLAAKHLLEHGHRRLAFVTASGKTLSRRGKIDGFLDAVYDSGVGAVAEVIESKAISEYGDSEMHELGRALVSQLLSRTERPTGIVAVNDMLALGLIAALRERGMTVPADMSVVGMDDLFLSTLSNPALTSVRSPIAEMAQTMVERAIGRLTEPELPAGEFLFAPELISRQSVARYKP